MRRYITVTRVVGRMPGITNAKNPSFLIKQIRSAASFRSRPREDYLSYLAISAAEWRGSSTRNVGRIFGASKLLVSPPVKAPRANRHMRALTHFINCHGMHEDTRFYGELDNAQYLAALSSQDVLKHARRGTVVAAECCFGAELYDPRLDADNKKDFPIAIAYLDRGAIGFLGSTTTAYGDVDEVGAADLMVQYFLVNVLDGASLGRALLQARQQFVLSERLDEETNLKTLGQFILLGILRSIPASATRRTSGRFAGRPIRLLRARTGGSSSSPSARPLVTARCCRASRSVSQVKKSCGRSRSSPATKASRRTISMPTTPMPAGCCGRRRDGASPASSCSSQSRPRASPADW